MRPAEIRSRFPGALPFWAEHPVLAVMLALCVPVAILFVVLDTVA
jgi:hypothetical protein